MRHKITSLADTVYEKLEEDILTGVYERGELLTELSLVESLGVSRTPIREAILRLEQEHLIKTTTKGIVIVGVGEQDIADIYLIRHRIEGLAAALAAKNATEEDIASLYETLCLQEFYVNRHDAENIKKLDSEFHAHIFRLTKSPILSDTLSPLHRKIEKYRRVAVQNVSRAAQSLAEHKRIYEAIAARDAEAADKLMAEHIVHAAGRLLGGGRE